MANNLDKNITEKLAKGFLAGVEHSRVLSKAVDTQRLDGKFNQASGTTVAFKRPHDFNTIETATGDISSSTKSDLVSGNATGTIQNFITVATEWSGLEDAVKSDGVDPDALRPTIDRMLTTLELNLGQFMINNCALSYGTPGTAVDAWGDVAGACSFSKSCGVPAGELYYAMNPFTTQALANTQSGLSSGSNNLVDSAWNKAQITRDLGGMMALSSNTLKTRTSYEETDRAGAINGTPTATYLAHKDTMIQSIVVDGFTNSTSIKAGDIVEVTGRYRLSLATREPILDLAGAKVKWRGTVVADAALTAGAGTITVAGPAIQEANGQYNTVEVALADNDVITVLGSASATYQPNLFFHKQAFGLGTAKLNKLFASDTVAWAGDGFSFRVSKYSDGDANKQMIRFDILPAFACFNPFYAGQGYGV